MCARDCDELAVRSTGRSCHLGGSAPAVQAGGPSACVTLLWERHLAEAVVVVMGMEMVSAQRRGAGCG